VAKHDPKPLPGVQHQHVKMLANELATLYRGLASEMNAAATVLERAERPDDRYPAVQPFQFAELIKKGAILHYALDQVLAQRALVRARRKQK
jgi:hypothetical protein